MHLISYKFKLTRDTQYLTLTGELWGTCCQYLGENWELHKNKDSMVIINWISFAGPVRSSSWRPKCVYVKCGWEAVWTRCRKSRAVQSARLSWAGRQRTLSQRLLPQNWNNSGKPRWKSKYENFLATVGVSWNSVLKENVPNIRDFLYCYENWMICCHIDLASITNYTILVHPVVDICDIFGTETADFNSKLFDISYVLSMFSWKVETRISMGSSENPGCFKSSVSLISTAVGIHSIEMQLSMFPPLLFSSMWETIDRDFGIFYQWLSSKL